MKLDGIGITHQGSVSSPQDASGASSAKALAKQQLQGLALEQEMGASLRKLTSASIQRAPRLPLTPVMKLDQLIRGLDPKDAGDPFPSFGEPGDDVVVAAFNSGMAQFWSRQKDDGVAREGAELVQHEFDRDIAHLVSQGNKLAQGISELNQWTGSDPAERLYDFLVSEKARLEERYQTGMANLEGSLPDHVIEKDVAMLTQLTRKLNDTL